MAIDTGTLRLILIILGALLILGIYLWERYHQKKNHLEAVRRGAADERHEPHLGGLDGAPTGLHASAKEEGLEEALQLLSGLVSEDRAASPSEPQPSPSETPAHTPRKEPLASTAPPEKEHDYWQARLPSLILQLNIKTRNGPFAGPDILRAIEGTDLQAGEMDIFHCHERGDSKGPVLFSLASMVKPGVFPMQAMGDFRTPGLTLFAQLPGPQDGLTLFGKMLSHARHIATALGGELQDETHSRLTKQTVEHIRSQIIEHQRQVQVRLAHSKKEHLPS